MTKRKLTLPNRARDRIEAAIDHVDARLAGEEDTAVVVRNVLAELFGNH